MVNPLVSVVIPVFNGEQYIAEAIKSVLAQTYHPVEIIVVNDGSTDHTEQIVKSFDEVIYIYQKNQGDAKARNIGIKATQGEYIAFIDHDDLWVPTKLKIQVGFLLDHPKTGFVICKMQNFIQPGSPEPEKLRGMYPDDEIFGYIPSTLLVRKNIFWEIGFFNPDMQAGSDIDWFFRAKDNGINMDKIDKLLVYRRIHQSNLSHQRSLESISVKEFLDSVRASVHRQQNMKSKGKN